MQTQRSIPPKPGPKVATLIAAVLTAALLSPATMHRAAADTVFTPKPILKTQFAGTFAGGAYRPAAGETMAGTLTMSGSTQAASGKVIETTSSDGLTFAPSASLGSGTTVNTSVAVEATAQRNSALIPSYDTLLSVAGGVDYRLGDATKTWRYDMYGMNNKTMVSQAEPTPSDTGIQHFGLVYTYLSSTSAQETFYIDGCQVGAALVNGSAAQLAANALGFGREVHPAAPGRAFHGTLTGVAAETFTGAFPGPSAFQLTAGQKCTQPSVSPNNVISVSPNDTTATLVAKTAALRPTARQLAYQQMETTAFIHFNMPTFVQLQEDDGRPPASTFNPTNLNTDEWAAALKAGGFKMAILTVKHADGFLLYPSAYSDYSVKSSPYAGGKGDIVAKFVDSMRKQGIKVGFYFSPLNRHEMNVVHSDWNPNYPRWGYSAAKGTRSCTVPATPIAGKPSFTFTVDEYNCLYMRELYEVFSNYGPIDEWWVDGNATSRAPYSNDGFHAWSTATGSPTQQYANQDWYTITKTLQPNMLVFNGWDIRWIGNETGFGTVGGEWSTVAISNQPTGGIPKVISSGGQVGSRGNWPGAANFTWLPTEADARILNRDHWFYNSGDKPQPLSSLWHMYAASVGRNANLLLDFGPDTTGQIPLDQVAAAKQFKAKIDAVAGTDLAGCPVTTSPDGFVFSCHMSKPTTFNWVGLQEDVANYGQRAEHYTVESLNTTGAWTPLSFTSWDNSGNQIADPTNQIGYKRLLHLNSAVTTTDIRVRVTGTRQTPHISSITVHNESAQPTGPIIGAGSSRCVDIPDADNTDGKQLQLYDCNGTTAQTWTLPGDGTLRAMGKCMDVRGGSNADKTPVQIKTCKNGTPAQQWTYDPATGELKALGKCLDAVQWGTANHTLLEIDGCWGGTNQQWRIPS